MAFKTFLVGLLFFGFACSPSYQQRRGGGAGFRPGGYVSEEGPPRPFQFNYNNQNDVGSTSYHQASGDQSGTVRGTYGYTDPDGVYRVVEYVASADGYRATVRTNEPGTEAKNPADVIMVVEPVPQAVLNRYANVGRPGRG